MKTIISAAALAISLSTAALAQQPAPTTAGPAEIFTQLPAGTTVANFYKQNVYDPSDNKIGDVDDVLIDKEGRVTATPPAADRTGTPCRSAGSANRKDCAKAASFGVGCRR